MKKVLLLLSVFLAFNANAQLQPGTQAPDFSTTDIYGNSVDLSDILDSGKHVLMDLSATWCGPCWAFHETHAMKDLYYAYGDGGSGEIAVIFVEGQSGNTIDQLNGIQGTTGNPYYDNTQGDWVEGTPYYIVDDAALANLYFANDPNAGFPTLFRICSSGTYIGEANRGSAASLASQFSSCGQMTGVQNHAKVEAENIASCDLSNTVVSANFKNYGVNAITSGTAVLKENGVEIATTNISGSTAQFAEGQVSFPSISADSNNTYTVEITSINGSSPFNTELATKTIEIASSPSSNSNEVEVHVYTDNYPSECSWSLLDSSGNEVASGGPYQAGTDDQWGGGGPDANTTKIHQVTLSEDLDCYTIVLNDGYGDGWTYGNTPHGVGIYSQGELIFEQLVGNFGDDLEFDNAFSAENNLSVSDLELVKFGIYPNPSNGIVNIKSEFASDVQVFDMTGKVVFAQKDVAPNASLDLSKLGKGVYVIQSSNKDVVESTKLIIK